MDYSSVISLATAKTYLRVDPGFTADDDNITRMVNAACVFVEKYTNILFVARDKEYVWDKYGQIRVYDDPINTDLTTLSDDISYEQKNGYYLFNTSALKPSNLSLNVGYELAADVPPELIECALEITNDYYYRKTDGNGQGISNITWQTLNQHKRFII
jgi:hypothetical protein